MIVLASGSLLEYKQLQGAVRVSDARQLAVVSRIKGRASTNPSTMLAAHRRSERELVASREEEEWRRHDAVS